MPNRDFTEGDQIRGQREGKGECPGMNSESRGEETEG